MIARLLIVLALCAGVANALSACNTVQGAGRDVEKAGQKIQNEAQEHRHY